MARSVSFPIGGKKVKLVASFDAASDICNEVHDLLSLFNDQQRSIFYFKIGRPYVPEFKFTVDAVVKVLAIGLRHARHDATEDDIKAVMVGIGLDKAQMLAQDYLSLFFAEADENPTDEKKGGGEKK